MSKNNKLTRQVNNSNLGRRNSSSIEDTLNQFKEQHPHCDNKVYEEVYRTLVSERENIKKRIKRAKSFARTNNSIAYNMKKKENNNKKYTVLASNNENVANFDFNKIEIAKAAASLFVLDDKYDTVMLIDNETNKGIHFDPMTDLTQEQRDKINDETITVDLDTDSSIGYGELSINDTIEDEYDFDLPDIYNCNDDRIMGGYDWKHERFDETREFYGFGDAGGEYFDMAAFKDEMSLEEFLVYAKQLMHLWLREEVCTKFKFHGFDGILVFSI